jgi:hypothetical protein
MSPAIAARAGRGGYADIKAARRYERVTFQRVERDLAATALWGSQRAGAARRGANTTWRLWSVVWQRPRHRPVQRRDASREHGRHVAPWRCHHGDGGRHTGNAGLAQSDWAMVDAYMPIVSARRDCARVMDYNLYAWAARYAGVWVGLKTMKDVESHPSWTATPHRLDFVTPGLHRATDG